MNRLTIKLQILLASFLGMLFHFMGTVSRLHDTGLETVDFLVFLCFIMNILLCFDKWKEKNKPMEHFYTSPRDEDHG